MEGVLNIFQSVLTTEKPEYINLYLNALDEHQSLRIENNADVAQKISSLLLKPNTRPLGFQLLQSFIKQASVDILEQKVNLWTTSTLKACNIRELEEYGVQVFETLENLAKVSQLSPDLTKSFTSTHLGRIYDSLSNVPASAYYAALTCVESCLRLYPGASGSAKGLIERYLKRLVDCADEELNIKCARIMHLLQQVRGGGVQGLNHKNQWQQYQTQLIGSLHELLDLAYAKCCELFDDRKEAEKLELPALELSNEPVQRTMQIYIRLRNLIGYLTIALSEPFPVAKPISLKKILNLIGRALAVTCFTMQRNAISDNIVLGTILPKIHLHFLQLLEALINIMPSYLRPHYLQILTMLFDALKWTSCQNSNGAQKPLIELRSKCYDLISLWCAALKSGSRCEIIAEFLSQEIFIDIAPYQNVFTLQVLTGTRKHMSKKARRQLHKAQNEQSHLAQSHANANASRKEHLSEEGNQKLCIAALKCLQNLLYSAANFIKPPILKLIHNKIIQIGGLFYELPLKRQQLYYNSTCRLEIYNCLFAMLMKPHHLCPPPTEIALRILQTAARRDGNLKVRQQCSMILLHFEKLMHPQKESLLFPIEARDVRNAFIKLGQERLLNGELINGKLTDKNNEKEPSDGSDNDSNDEMDVDNESNELNICSSELSMRPSQQSNDNVAANDAEYIENIDTTADDNSASLQVVSSEDESICVLSEQQQNTVSSTSKPASEHNSTTVENNTSPIDLVSEDEINDKLARPPSPKKAKLNVEEVSTPIPNSAIEASKEEETVVIEDDDDKLFADIEATFVDELNELD